MQTHKVAGVSRALIGVAAVILLAFLYVSTASAASTGNTMPTSDGFYTQWTPSTGTSHFALVDETPCNGTTDYNSTTVVGNRDSYGVSLASVPDGATITRIDIKPCASRVSSGGTNPVMNVFYRSNGFNSANAGSYSLTGTTPTELATSSYSSLALIKSSTSTLEVGAVLTSSTKGARLSRIVTTLTYTALTAPTNLTGVAWPSSTSTAIRLSWSNGTTSIAGHAIERSTDAVNWVAIASTTGTATNYYDNSGLSVLTTYYHRVRAFNYAGYSTYSNVATTTTIDFPPTAPSGIIVTPSFIGSSTWDMIVDWNDNSSNETGFVVQRSFNGSSYTHIATTSADTITYTDPSRTAGTYSYRVRAFNSGGNSAFTTSASTTIP